MKPVRLSQGLFAIVDDSDYERVVAAGAWHARRVRAHATYYAMHTVWLGNRKTLKLCLHTFLTGWDLVDHADGNGLNNTRSNLRPATRSQNGANSPSRRGSLSPFKGVSRTAGSTRWRARIKVNGATQHLGSFANEEDAARAYDNAAQSAFGEYALLNFPEEGHIARSARSRD